MILVKILLTFNPFFGYEIIDGAENEGKTEATEHIGNPVHVSENAADRDEGSEGEHDEIKEDADVDVFDVILKIKSGHDKDSRDDHGVGRREGWLAGAIWAGVQDENFIKEEINNNHQDERQESPEEIFVDFGEGLT